MWQEKAQIYENKFNESASNSFLLCLIDGDGYLFNDNLIGQGALGGGEAANRLLNNIKRHIQQFEGAMHWRIIVRVYANIEGLLKKFAYIGFTEEENALRQFVAGFTQSQPLFDFVDAGQGKERADHKIKDPYKNSLAVASRISLLKAGQLGREFYGLPFEVVQFDSVFRMVELPNERPPYKIPNKPIYPYKPPSQPVAPQKEKSAVAQDITARRPIYPGPVLLNKDDERVDEYLGTPSEWGETLLASYIRDGNKLCNVHHLLQRCNSGSRCPYSHEPFLEGDELVAFALRARLTACHAGSRCRNRMCVLGHLCPHGANCPRKKTCYFNKVHHVDPRIDHEFTDMEYDLYEAQD
ncbi:MAG: hypothetical protein Q9209_007399 [Squamulea sp. 1 TL-2023]